MKMYLLLILAVLGFCMTSCTESEDNPVKPEQPVVTDPVAQWLSAIPGVSDVEIKVRGAETKNPENVYYFCYDQLIDHSAPAKGTFKQYAALTYRGIDAANVLITEGYNMHEDPDSIVDCGFDVNREANWINVEYRYFGNSLPEAFHDFDFNYLNSEQASDDLHAIVSALQKSGRFPKAWISTGVSKSGITTAFYAYYSEKKGYDDIDLYMPFCAPFCEAVDDPRPGKYIENSNLTHAPEAKTKLEAFAKAILTNAKLCDYLVDYVKAQDPNYVAELKKAGYTDEDIYWILANYWVSQNQSMLVGKLSYVPIAMWKDLIPNPEAATAEELAYALKYINMDDVALLKYIYDLKKNSGKAGTRITLTDEQLNQLLKARLTNYSFPYYVQALRELGSFKLTFDFLKGVPGFNYEWTEYFSNQSRYNTIYPMYNGNFSNEMTLDFINNFLPTTQKKMIFVYGGQDHWTGAAIPDPTNPNVKKIIVPGGTHNDWLYNRDYYSEADCKAIFSQMNEFLK